MKTCMKSEKTWMKFLGRKCSYTSLRGSMWALVKNSRVAEVVDELGQTGRDKIEVVRGNVMWAIRP